MNIGVKKTVGRVTLAIFLMGAAIGDRFPEMRAGLVAVAQDTERPQSVTWNTGTYVSPRIPGLPKAVLYEDRALRGVPLTAIWDDGTIAWRDKNAKEPDAYFVSKISTLAVDEALQGIKNYTARNYPHRRQAVGTRNCPMDDVGIGFVLLDRELFVWQHWSYEALQGQEQVKRLLKDSAEGELVQYLRSRLERPAFDKPWHFLAEDYAKYVGMTSEDFLNVKSAYTLRTVATHFVKDGDHFVFCRERVQALIPKPQADSPFALKPLDFSWRPIVGEGDRDETSGKHVLSYRLREEARPERN